MTRILTATLGLVLVLALGLAACGTDDGGSTAAPEAPASSAPATTEAEATATANAVDQDGDGTTLTVASVELDGVSQGWIAVHRDLDGKPGPVVGTVQVSQGDSSDVVVELDETVATGAFWPMLHVDDNTVGTYEFPQWRAPTCRSWTAECP